MKEFKLTDSYERLYQEIEEEWHKSANLEDPAQAKTARIATEIFLSGLQKYLAMKDDVDFLDFREYE